MTRAGAIALLGHVLDGLGVRLTHNPAFPIRAQLRCRQNHLLAVIVDVHGTSWLGWKAPGYQKHNGWRTEWLDEISEITDCHVGCGCAKEWNFEAHWLNACTGNVGVQRIPRSDDPEIRKLDRSRFGASKSGPGPLPAWLVEASGDTDASS